MLMFLFCTQYHHACKCALLCLEYVYEIMTLINYTSILNKGYDIALKKPAIIVALVKRVAKGLVMFHHIYVFVSLLNIHHLSLVPYWYRNDDRCFVIYDSNIYTSTSQIANQ